MKVNSATAGGASVTIGVGRCLQIRHEIASNTSEIEALQDEPKHASPGEKAAIVARIRALHAEHRRLAAEARTLGCS